jgi:hypothetical protein
MTKGELLDLAELDALYWQSRHSTGFNKLICRNAYYQKLESLQARGLVSKDFKGVETLAELRS